MKKIIFYCFLTVLLVIGLGCEKTKYQNNIISSAHPLASKSGKKMYELGGNAFDAAVSAAFTLSVVEPSMSGLGGRLQAIYINEGKIGGVDASTEVPLLYKPTREKFEYGYKTIGIPGVVAGLIKLHEENGLLPLEKVMAPAINYAKNGFEILPGEVYRQKLASKIFKEFDGTSFHFLKEDKTNYENGELFVQETLSKVLEKISKEGKKGFYEGEIAEKIVSDIQKNGGIITLNDLKNYQALDSRIVKGKYKNHNIYSLFLPSFGAITIQILQILDNLPSPKTEEEWALNMGSATKLAYKSRNYQINEDSLKKILSYNQAKKSVKELFNKKIISNNSVSNQPKSWIADIGHTTHLTTADKKGNIVSLTQTIGPLMGSKVASKELGFLYAVTLGGYLGNYKPGDRANSHISPVMIFKDNSPVLALGAAGGSRIITAITQVTSRYISQKNSLSKALELPRVYPYDDTLQIENHESLKNINAKLNQKMTPFKLIDGIARFGRVHAVALDSINQKWIGAADPDWEGTVEYYQ